MKKIKAAIFFGGCSPEYGVSLESAYAVLQNLNKDKYDPIPIGITHEGKWYYFSGDLEKIRTDSWQNDADCVPAVLSPDRGARKLLLFRDGRTDTLDVDVAFPVMHGKYGEDGTIQGLIGLSGIPLAGCGVLPSALGMDKDRAHKLASLSGVAVPKSIVIFGDYETGSVRKFAKDTGYPLFVKPVKAGSSYGISKVWCESELISAIAFAFTYDDSVIIEESIDGFEVGCAVLGNEELTVGEVDEIELASDLFDFTEKYTLKTASIHVPARVSGETAEKIKETAKGIYRALGCTGFARVDMFLTSRGEIVFNEVNTIPGFTEHSRYPAMMQAAGIPFQGLLDTILELAVMKK